MQSPPCQKKAKEVRALRGHKPLETLSCKPQGQAQPGGLHPPLPGGSRKGSPRLPQLARRRSYLEIWTVILSSFTRSPRDSSGSLLPKDEGHHPWQKEQFFPVSAPALPPNGPFPWDSLSLFTAPWASVGSTSKLRVGFLQTRFTVGVTKPTEKQKEGPPVLGPWPQHL